MKKLLLVAALFFIVGGAFAQHKGKMYIGTSLMLPSQTITGVPYPEGSFTTGFNSSRIGDERITTFGVAPEFGVFVSDHVVLGIVAGYNHVNVKDGNTSNAYGVNPYMRYYFWVGDRLGLFLQPGVSYISSKISGQNTNNVFYAGIKPGIDYKLSERFDLVAHFGNLGFTDYGKTTNGLGVDRRISSFDFTLNMASLNIALVYVF